MIFRLLLLLLIIVPIIEIFLLLSIGSLIGVIPTILCIVFTAILGAVLLRWQGINTLSRVQQILAQGQLPAIELLEGLMLLIAAALLLTPGFFTDSIGFLSLVPNIRRIIASQLLKRGLQAHRQRTTEQQASAHKPSAHQPKTIEGEFWEDNK